MLNLLDPKRVRQGARLAEYHPVPDDSSESSSEMEKGDSMSSTAVESEEDETPMMTPDKRGKTARAMARRLVKKLGVLLPSFLQQRRRNSNVEEPRQTHPTAWLDGLRGIAAFFVVWHHMSLLFFSWDLHCGWEGFGDNPLQLPIIRLAISGIPNVYVFFVISGYALSYKPLKLVRQGRLEETYSTLASSAFRRHSRLFMPATVVCFFSMLMTYLRLFGDGHGITDAATATMEMPHFGTIWEQFSDYAHFMLRLCDPFSLAPGWWIYNEPLWTLPVEFRSSFVVFGLMLALASSSARSRVVIVSIVSIFCLYAVHLPEFLFCGGMLVAAIRIQFNDYGDADNQSIVLEKPARKVRTIDTIRSWWAKLSRFRPLRLAGSLICFAVSLFVLSTPEIVRGGGSAAGYWTMARLIPVRYFLVGTPENFWISQGAIALIFTVDHSPLLQKLFTNRFAQYLGRISYSLYLIHGLLLQSVGWFLGKFLVDLIDVEVNAQYTAAIALNALVFWSIAIWAADLGWRFIDIPSVRLSAWLHKKLCGRRF